LAGEQTPAGEPCRRFVNRSEAEFARLLEYYRIPYEYEPRSFPLKWDEQGKVIEAFTPDFYLPDEDLYIEITVMKQSLATRKNRKLRLMKQLYPEVNIKLLFRGDFQALAAKYGWAESEGASRPDEPTVPQALEE
jgi:hypothetical protein